jgi:hypothetical protein
MKKIICLLITLFMLGCVSTPKPWVLPTDGCVPGEFFFKTLEGFEMEHELCGSDTIVITWNNHISIWSDECTEIGTNLFTYWDGCDYILFQNNKEGDYTDIMKIGRFGSFKKLAEFLEATRPLVEQPKGCADDIMKGIMDNL